MWSPWPIRRVGSASRPPPSISAASLAFQEQRVLLIDLDPQGNATSGLGIDRSSIDVSIYDVLLKESPLDDAIEPTSVRNLFVVPATIDLAGAEIELVSMFSRETRLRSAIAEIEDDFDLVLIDCPPSLGLLTVNALTAAQEVVIPIQCEYYALEGLSQLLRNVELVSSNLNPELEGWWCGAHHVRRSDQALPGGRRASPRILR